MSPIAAYASGNVESESTQSRRLDPRHEIERRIIALGDEAARVLIGRDLSMGGMRVDPAPGVNVDDELRIALHVPDSPQPLVVSARITRDDGEAGMALQFVDLTDLARECLEGMIHSLPSISEPDGKDEGAGVIVSEMVEHRAS